MAVIRSTITIPEELKEQMDANAEGNNWSKIACDAFRRVLGLPEGATDKSTLAADLKDLRKRVRKLEKFRASIEESDE